MTPLPMTPIPRRVAAAARAILAALALALAGCAGPFARAPEEARAQDGRRFAVDEAGLRATLTATDPAQRGGNGAFLPLQGFDTDRWVGTLDGAGWQIEVPRNWNGMLVLYAHGYRGTGERLTVTPPTIRRHLVGRGFAWASSSYARNYYDVRAGVEDTNALALAFTRIARENGRVLAEPTRRFVIGHSMGGHVAAAAVERETMDRAVNRVRYDAAMPMCGVMSDVEIFDGFGAYQSAVQQLAGLPASAASAPGEWAALDAQLKARYFSTFPNGSTAGVLTPEGERLKQVVRHLSGGDRPGFDAAFLLAPARGGHTPTVWGGFGRDGTIDGILNRKGIDTRGIVYRFDADPAASAELNRAAFRFVRDPQANRLRSDGLRWIPTLPAQVSVPVVTLHTLGDSYVWWRNQQRYRERANAAGTSQWVVQRAIRGAGHCDFTLGEQEEGFDAMLAWQLEGRRPAGDEVLDAALTATPTYGCGFSREPRADDAAVLRTNRPLLAACPAGSARPNFEN